MVACLRLVSLSGFALSVNYRRKYKDLPSALSTKGHSSAKYLTNFMLLINHDGFFQHVNDLNVDVMKLEIVSPVQLGSRRLHQVKCSDERYNILSWH